MSSSHDSSWRLRMPSKYSDWTKQWHDEVKALLTICIEQHGDECRASKSMKCSDKWLIDVKRACIVPAASHRFIALSYVWGNIDSSKLTMKNMASLQVPGALEHADIKIPRTISDTMVLTSDLGYNYLWVDIFCIVQDDTAVKHMQILQMAEIYSNADLTIIAAGAGRDLNANEALGEPMLLKTFDPNSLSPSSSKWYTRGWTFQELYFSPRKIKFQNRSLMWECRQHTSYITGNSSRVSRLHDLSQGGEGVFEDDVLYSTDLRRSARITPWPIFTGRTAINLDQYAKMVTQYNSRHLTYPEDGMAAFLGVTNWLSNSFRGGFLWGLPVESFDIAILWQPRGPLVRRNTHGVLLPSWSWVGWQGNINEHIWATTTYDFKALGLGVSLDHGESRIIPLCKWYFTEDESHSVVETKYDIHQHDLHQRDSLNPEPGEILTTVNKLERKSIIEAPTNPNPLIRTRTETIVLSLGTNTSISGDTIFITSDNGDQSKPIGIMHFSAGIACSLPLGLHCKLIALSKGVARRRDHRQWNSVDSSFDVNFAYYNAMWVEQDESSHLFSRKGLAMVSIEGWESGEPELVDVTLA